MAQYGSKGHEGLTAQSHLFEHRLGVAHAKTPHKKEFHTHSINIEGNATHEEYN